ncbi:hypothetical protein JMK10_10730 [Rhodovulum sulfidophilum]|uniref:hypothetical protein n=1 Tax=Rhodovulum sulfidophilum TaxID=35806 RepID=UPI0019217A1D|nr:hypothetical protein [Rhodovulum sulfidophilum]MBL3576211.1 hypothetical protein [Rhodovulum sulfidophilum]MCE8431593.1 hypothetical protein [Rhodovulum sulfidophilum]MCF4117279.1 hypothetical protein [Rhodovulum sulfidophilum]
MKLLRLSGCLGLALVAAPATYLLSCAVFRDVPPGGYAYSGPLPAHEKSGLWAHVWTMAPILTLLDDFGHKEDALLLPFGHLVISWEGIRYYELSGEGEIRLRDWQASLSPDLQFKPFRMADRGLRARLETWREQRHERLKNLKDIAGVSPEPGDGRVKFGDHSLELPLGFDLDSSPNSYGLQISVKDVPPRERASLYIERLDSDAALRHFRYLNPEGEITVGDWNASRTADGLWKAHAEVICEGQRIGFSMVADRLDLAKKLVATAKTFADDGAGYGLIGGSYDVPAKSTTIVPDALMRDLADWLALEKLLSSFDSSPALQGMPRTEGLPQYLTAGLGASFVQIHEGETRLPLHGNWNELFSAPGEGLSVDAPDSRNMCRTSLLWPFLTGQGEDPLAVNFTFTAGNPAACAEMIGYFRGFDPTPILNMPEVAVAKAVLPYVNAFDRVGSYQDDVYAWNSGGTALFHARGDLLFSVKGEISPEYREQGLYTQKDAGKLGLVDRQGVQVLSVVYDAFERFSPDMEYERYQPDKDRGLSYILVRRGEAYGIFDLSGRRWVLPVGMDDVSPLRKWNMFSATKAGTSNLYDLDGAVIPGTLHVDAIFNHLQTYRPLDSEFIALEHPDGTWTVRQRGDEPLLDQRFQSVTREDRMVGPVYHFKTTDGDEFALDEWLEPYPEGD